MSHSKDRHWLIPLVLITIATLAVYAIYVVSDLRTAHAADTYRVTVEHQSDLPSPVDSTTTTDSTSAGSDTTDESNTGDAPDADNTTSDNPILHATDVPEGSYIGNKNSEKYHRFDCEYGAMVQDNNLIVFDTLEDAINSGYKPCGACHPDEQSSAE